MEQKTEDLFEVEVVDYSYLMPEDDGTKEAWEEDFMSGVLKKELRHDTLITAKADAEKAAAEKAAKRASGKKTGAVGTPAAPVAPRKVMFGDAPVLPVVKPVSPMLNAGGGKAEATSTVETSTTAAATAEPISENVETIAAAEPVVTEPVINEPTVVNTEAEQGIVSIKEDAGAPKDTAKELNSEPAGITKGLTSTSTENDAEPPKIDETEKGVSLPPEEEDPLKSTENGQNELVFSVPETTLPTEAQTFENTPVLLKHRRSSQVSYPCVIIERTDVEHELRGAQQILASLLKAQRNDVRYPVYIKSNEHAHSMHAGSIDASSLRTLLTLGIFSVWKISIKDSPDVVYTDDMRFAFCACS